MKYRHVSDGEIRGWAANIVREMALDGFKPDAIVAPNRGGLTAGVMLSHYYKCPLYPVQVSLRDADIVDHVSIHNAFRDAWSQGSILIIDDINDTGQTLKTLQESTVMMHVSGPTRYAVLLEKSRSKISCDYVGEHIYEDREQEWVVFPWENWWAV